MDITQSQTSSRDIELYLYSDYLQEEMKKLTIWFKPNRLLYYMNYKLDKINTDLFRNIIREYSLKDHSYNEILNELSEICNEMDKINIIFKESTGTIEFKSSKFLSHQDLKIENAILKK